MSVILKYDIPGKALVAQPLCPIAYNPDIKELFSFPVGTKFLTEVSWKLKSTQTDKD